jgi:hypothetical protein
MKRLSYLVGEILRTKEAQKIFSSNKGRIRIYHRLYMLGSRLIFSF